MRFRLWTCTLGMALSLSTVQVCSEIKAKSGSPFELLQELQQLVQQQRFSEARQKIVQALRDNASEPRLHNLLGVVEARQGNFEAAESNFKHAIELAPEFPGAYLNLGRLYQENLAADPSGAKKAVEIYSKLLQREPGNLEANYQIAVLLQAQGDFRASLNHLSRLPPVDQERPQALALRLLNHVGLREHERTDEVLQSLLAGKDLVEADVLFILTFLEAQDHDDLQLRLLEGTARRGLASSETLHRLALVYERAARLAQARETLEKVAALQPITSGLLLELARIANKQKDYTGALGYLAHARDLDPQNAAIHFFFGMVCVDLNLGQEAYESLKRAVSLDPTNPFHHYAFGAVAISLKDPSEAIPHFEKYCELKPQDRSGRFALGAAYFYSGKYQAAQKVLEEVQNFPETSAGAHYFLALLAKQDGDIPRAVQELEHSVQANPAHADAYAELGILRIWQKEYELAEKALLRALTIDSEHYLANLNLLILYRRTKDARAEAQAQRFEKIKEQRSERARAFLRNIEVQPY